MQPPKDEFSMNRALASGPVVWAGIILVTCLLLVVFQTALWLVLPIFIAVLFQVLLAPFVNYGISRGLTRAQAVFSVTALLWIFIIAVCLIMEPKVSQTVHGLRNGKVEEYIREASEMFASTRKMVMEKFSPLKSMAPESRAGESSSESRAASAPPLLPSNFGPIPKPEAEAAPSPDEELQHNINDWTSRYSGGIALELLHWVPSLLLVPYLTYFFLLDGPRFKKFLVQAIPNAFFEKTLYLFYRVEEQVRSYLRGVLLLTMADWLCLGIGLWLLGLDGPFFLAGIAAVIAWLPYLGSIAGCLLVVLVAHHDHPESALLPFEAIGLFIAVRLCDDFIFLPMTVGRSLRMHPLITVLMILLGGAVGGIAGLLLVMPVLGVVMVVGQIGGELLTDERVIARYRHARALRRQRAQAGL